MSHIWELVSAGQLAGHDVGLPLWEVLGGGDVLARDLRLLSGGRRKLLVLHLGFSHVVIARVKILLLCGENQNTGL